MKLVNTSVTSQIYLFLCKPRGGAGGISPPGAIWKELPGQVWFKDMNPWPPLSTPGSMAST